MVSLFPNGTKYTQGTYVHITSRFLKYHFCQRIQSEETYCKETRGCFPVLATVLVTTPGDFLAELIFMSEKCNSLARHSGNFSMRVPQKSGVWCYFLSNFRTALFDICSYVESPPPPPILPTLPIFANPCGT